MTGNEKVAILFRVLGSEFARPMCERLRPDEVSRIGDAMVRFEKQPPAEEAVKAVLEEYQSSMAHGGIFANVSETLQEMFIAKFGSEEGPKVLDEVRVNSQTESPFKGLQGVPYADLARILSEEHPQVQAAVLANLDASISAGVLSCMDEDRRTAIVHRIATMRPPPPRLLRDLADMFIRKTSKLPRFHEDETMGPSPSIRRVADILNASGAGNEAILGKLESDTPELVETIRETMFTFDDLSQIDKISMQKVLGGIDTKLLAMALKSCQPETTEAILSAVSQRSREMITEEKELLGAVPLTEVQLSQKEIMLTIRGLIESGELKFSPGGASGQLVE